MDYTPAECIARAKREIVEDAREGIIPATTTRFADLHDYVDANEYGGLCDDEFFEMARGTDLLFKVGGDVQDAVNEWLTEGGLQAALAAE